MRFLVSLISWVLPRFQLKLWQGEINYSNPNSSIDSAPMSNESDKAKAINGGDEGKECFFEFNWAISFNSSCWINLVGATVKCPLKIFNLVNGGLEASCGSSRFPSLDLHDTNSLQMERTSWAVPGCCFIQTHNCFNFEAKLSRIVITFISAYKPFRHLSLSFSYFDIYQLHSRLLLPHKHFLPSSRPRWKKSCEKWAAIIVIENNFRSRSFSFSWGLSLY